MARVSSIASRKARIERIVNKMVIKDRIQRAYVSVSNELNGLKKYKRQQGYCGGSPSCLVHTGEAAMCADCRNKEKNPKSSRPLMEYGKIRQRERAAEKQKKTTRIMTPKRRAA
jgi:hypothetical protein